MKPVHRILLLFIPALICGLSSFFYARADNKFENQMQQVEELRTHSANSEDALGALSARQEHFLSAARATQKSQSFWFFARALSFFFVGLSVVFLVYESRHRHQRDQLIASFSEEEASPPADQ